jgi:acetyl esterase/lipase
MTKLLRALALFVLAASSLNYLKIHSLWTSVLFIPRVFAGSFSPQVGVLGLLAALIGWRRKDRGTLLAGGLATGLALNYMRQVIAPHQAFEAAFGDGWRAKISPRQRAAMLPRRWTWRLTPTRHPRCERDVVYATLPESGRELLCDVWQPAWDVPPSGLAVIRMHGSAWHYGDKGMESSLFCKHLTAQGHVVVDIAYRLAPETDLFGMIGDVKRAIAWLKANAAKYHVNPNRIVLAGGSAGAHLALLTAYSGTHPALTPADLDGDLSLRGVISYYGPVDIRSIFANGKRIYEQNRTLLKVLENLYKSAGWIDAEDGLATPDLMMTNLVGCLPEERPDLYDLVSPLCHVSPDCPPTLMFQGGADWLIPAVEARALHQALTEAGVQAVYVEIPHTDHGFDLFQPAYSPAAQSALYDVERFLALLA